MKNKFLGILQQPTVVSVLFLVSVVALISCLIVGMNDGQLIYTLDDPYIHLALAENLLKGHYGINLSEVSAPSSSILWPFIVAPFSSSPLYLLFINVFFAILTVIAISKLLAILLPGPQKPTRSILLSVLVILFVLATNMVGIAFTGMEHSLQVLLVVWILYGLILERESKTVQWWLIACIVVAPLVRYECLAISIPAMGYLFLRGHYLVSTLTAGMILIALSGFAFFLTSLGLDPFPSSVSAKSSVVSSGGALNSLVENFMNSVMKQQARILVFSILLLIVYFVIGKSVENKILALAVIGSILMHFVAGRFDWYNRYEIYILVFTLLGTIAVWSSALTRLVEKYDGGRAFISLLLGVVLVGVVIGKRYIDDLFTIPLATNNIYEQQYQMGRFVKEFAKAPIAVNDLGLVKYQNENYVLDLWGLGSSEALKLRMTGGDPLWMESIVAAKNVELIMIYDDWFKVVPSSWVKLGELKLSGERITPARSSVSFYIADSSYSQKYQDLLERFVPTLPVGVRFHSDSDE